MPNRAILTENERTVLENQDAIERPELVVELENRISVELDRDLFVLANYEPDLFETFIGVVDDKLAEYYADDAGPDAEIA